jgi:hypothetical protein
MVKSCFSILVWKREEKKMRSIFLFLLSNINELFCKYNLLAWFDSMINIANVWSLINIIDVWVLIPYLFHNHVYCCVLAPSMSFYTSIISLSPNNYLNKLSNTFHSIALCVQKNFNPKKFYAQII